MGKQQVALYIFVLVHRYVCMMFPSKTFRHIKKIFLFFIAARPRLFGRPKNFLKYYFKYLLGAVMSVHDVQVQFNLSRKLD